MKGEQKSRHQNTAVVSADVQIKRKMHAIQRENKITLRRACEILCLGVLGCVSVVGHLFSIT